MSHVCGYPTVDGAWCTHMVADPQKPDCGRHTTFTPKRAVRFVGSDCVMRQIEPRVWRCGKHHTPEWETAVAMGMEMPCRIPLKPPQRQALAEHPNLDPITASALARDPTRAVVAVLAQNPQCPPDMLNLFLDSEDRAIRRAAVTNPAVPPETRSRLLQDPENARWLKTWSRIDADTFLQVAAQLRDGHQLEDLFQGQNIPRRAITQSCRSQFIEMRIAVATCPDVPVRLLTILSTDTTARVRGSVACNQHTPSQILKYLAADPDWNVRSRAAQHPSTPPEALERLAKDSERWVIDGAIQNPSLPNAALERLAQPDSGVRSYVRRLIKSELARRQKSEHKAATARTKAK